MMKYDQLSEYIGIIAGIGTTFSFFPQVWKVYTDSQSVSGLSPYMMMIHFVGGSCWIVYGILQNDYIITGFNSITIVLLSAIIIKYVGSVVILQ